MPIQIGDVVIEEHLIYAGGTAIEEVRAGTELVYPSHPSPILNRNMPNIELRFGQYGGSWTYDAAAHFAHVEPGSTWKINNRPAYIHIDANTGMMSITGELTDRGEYNISVTVTEPHGGIRQATSNTILLNNRIWATGYRFQVNQANGCWSRRNSAGYCVSAAKLELWQDGNRITSSATAQSSTSSAVYQGNQNSFGGSHLFDGNAGTYWHNNCTNNASWVDWNMSVLCKITKLQVQARSDQAFAGRTPDSFAVFAWVNSRWVNITSIQSYTPIYRGGTFRNFVIQ